MTQGESTIKMYEFYINRFKNDDLDKPKEMLEKIVNMKTRKNERLSIACVKVILSAFVWKLKKENNTDKKVIEKYQEYIKELKQETAKTENDHSKIHGKIPKWEDIIKARDDEKDKGHDKNHLVLSLYTYVPPRRLKDYTYMKIANNSKDMKDVKYNYYNMKDKEFIFNVYKTAKTHKKQTENVPEELSEIINKYISSNKLKSGDLLLGFRDYHQIYYILNKIIGCGVDNIRHSFVNNEYNAPALKKLKENAEKMGHSVETHMLYQKDV